MQGPKVTVIGAGSFFFGRPVIHKFATSPYLAGGTLALVDTNPRVVNTMVQLAKRICKKTKADVTVVGHTDRKKVMKDSDFVVLTFSDRNAHFRGIDTSIALKHGIRMCSSDTIGPGGIFRAMREIPHVMDIVGDVRKLCPNAWVINFINPTAVIGTALKRFAPDIRSFALCDGHHEPWNTLTWCKRVGILPESATTISPAMWNELDLRIGGINHCTWMTKFSYQGKDYLPKWRSLLAQQAKEQLKNPSEDAKSRHNANYQLQLFDLYGAYPTAGGHTQEYVPFFQGYGVAANTPEPLRTFDAVKRQQNMDASWKKTEEWAQGKLSEDSFLKEVHNDHATDIIESMWAGLGKPFYINSENRGAITNMPDDALVELRSDLDMRGPRHQPFGAIPRGVLAIQMQVLDTHELTAEAAVTGDKTILRRAMLTDPICNNIADADNCIADLLAAERDALPAMWYKKSH